jgi:quercetin dioxygenase-like cupin family protein
MSGVARDVGTSPAAPQERAMTPQATSSGNHAQAGTVHFLGIPTIVQATGATTGGAFGLVDHLAMPPGFASPYHTHQAEDEAFYVIDGEVAFVLGDTWSVAGPGTYVFGPRQVPHGFKVLGDAPAHMLLLCTPGGFEQFIVELSTSAPAPPDMAQLMAVAARFHIDIHGPLPQEPEAIAARASQATLAGA